MLPTLDVAFPSLSILVCIGLIVAVLGTRQLRGRLVQLLLAWFFSLIVWNVSLSWSPDRRPLFAQYATVASSVAIGVLFWALIQHGQGRLPNLWHWIATRVALAMALSVLVVLGDVFGVDDRSPLETWVWQGFATAIWATFAVSGIVSVAQQADRLESRLFVYGLIAFVFLGIGVFGVLSTWSPLGVSAPLWATLGIVATTVVVLNVHAVEARSIFRSLFIYVLVTLLTGLILVASLYILRQAFSGAALGLGVIIASGTVGMIYALMHRVASLVIDRLLFGEAADLPYHLHNFNKRATDILDPVQLSETMMLIAGEAFGVQRGVLLVGDSEGHLDNIAFQVVGNSELASIEPIRFRAFSPLMDDLRRKGVSVTQEALDKDPRYAIVREQEREWLKSLGMRLFVPIRSRGQLIGILALGDKARGSVYRANEVEFLSELAERSGFPLQNARLFSEMRTLNTVLNRLYTDLDVVNRRLQEMDKLKSAFIGVVTHELRSPLAGVDFSLQLLQRQVSDRLDPEQAETVRDIVKGVDQLKAMIDKLVNFAAFLSKQGELRKTQVDLGQIVQEVVDPLIKIAQMRQINLQVQLAEVLPPVWADRERIAEAVHHLVHNAIKFTPAQGQVTVSCAADENLINLRIVDTGVGVSADKLKTIWDGFSQAADSLRRGVEGLGLGLALVKYIVTAHGGEVWAFSRVGEGSTFGFRIPLGKPPELGSEEFSLVSDGKASWGQ
ncbi:MAG: GAF domain-containing protein [Anaerolineae bacterium]|nr:GAF domain-containing protein [Anaerolineae bacterium]